MCTKLIFGCGYLGERVAERWRAARARRCRRHAQRSERAEQFAGDGYDGDRRRRHAARIADVNLPAAETVLFAVGYDRGGGQIDRRTSTPAACGTCWPHCLPSTAASSTSARPASTARPAANGSTKRRRPIRSATAAGHRWRPSKCSPHIRSARGASSCDWPASTAGPRSVSRRASRRRTDSGAERVGT